jgi:enoyl-CoA hydratase/carnithine racemase
MLPAMSVDYQTILFDSSGPIARITLNQPQKRNPISPQSLGELAHAMQRVRDSEETRVLIITGAGKAFSAGGDLSQLSGSAAPDSTVKPVSLVSLLEQMHDLGKPIIAMVNGHALAGGMGLMVACDLVVASDKASFGTTEINVGLWPMMITAEITRNIGRKKTLELMLTGRRIDAAEALSLGLINQHVPAEDLEEVTMKLASELANKSPATIALGLRAFYETQDMDFGASLARLEAGLAQVLSTEDAREGLMAFLQKRPPVWKGR